MKVNAPRCYSGGHLVRIGCPYAHMSRLELGILPMPPELKEVWIKRGIVHNSADQTTVS